MLRSAQGGGMNYPFSPLGRGESVGKTSMRGKKRDPLVGRKEEKSVKYSNMT